MTQDPNLLEQQQNSFHRRNQISSRTSITQTPIGQPAYARTFFTPAATNQQERTEVISIDNRRSSNEDEQRKRHMIELERRQKLIEEHRLKMLQRQQEEERAAYQQSQSNVNQPKNQQPELPESVPSSPSTADVEQSRILYPEYLSHFARLNFAKVYAEMNEIRDQMRSFQDTVRHFQQRPVIDLTAKKGKHPSLPIFK